MRNRHRNTPPVQWDQQLANGAKKWAEKLVKENGGKIMHCKTRGENVGENLFVAMQTQKFDENDLADKATEQW